MSASLPVGTDSFGPSDPESVRYTHAFTHEWARRPTQSTMVANLDAKMLRFMSADEFRVLIAAEMGMKNHEIVPTSLIESISALKRGGTFKLIATLAKHKLIAHQSIPYDGYRLTSKGYDYLALKAFSKRGTLAAMGIQIGVGKESDIFTVMSPEGQEVCLKLHRLGRTCFRSVKNNRDYMRAGQAHASWMYLSRLSALKEYAFMRALYAHGFPVPEPLDVNRHCVVMRLASGYQLNSIQELTHPGAVFQKLMDIIIRLAEHGLIHGDFNEFNLMVNDEEQITVIDFPQMISTSHINAEYYFNRDVNCVKTFFKRRFGFEAVNTPTLAEDTVRGAQGIDLELKASGWTEAYSKDFGALSKMAEEAEAAGGGEESDGDDEDEESEEEDDEEESGAGAADGSAGPAAGGEAAPTATGPAQGGVVDAAQQRREELAELEELAKVARQPAAAASEAPSAAAATVDPSPMVDLSDLGAQLPAQPTTPSGEAAVGAAAAVEPARSEIAPSERSMSSARGTRHLDAKERVKLELKSSSRRQQQTSGRAGRNESKDREKRKLHASVKKEAAGTSGW